MEDLMKKDRHRVAAFILAFFRALFRVRLGHRCFLCESRLTYRIMDYFNRPTHAPGLLEKRHTTRCLRCRSVESVAIYYLNPAIQNHPRHEPFKEAPRGPEPTNPNPALVQIKKLP